MDSATSSKDVAIPCAGKSNKHRETSAATPLLTAGTRKPSLRKASRSLTHPASKPKPHSLELMTQFRQRLTTDISCFNVRQRAWQYRTQADQCSRLTHVRRQPDALTKEEIANDGDACATFAAPLPGNPRRPSSACESGPRTQELRLHPDRRRSTFIMDFLVDQPDATSGRIRTIDLQAARVLDTLPPELRSDASGHIDGNRRNFAKQAPHGIAEKQRSSKATKCHTLKIGWLRSGRAWVRTSARSHQSGRKQRQSALG
ncbi:hypothetical protein D3C71_197070 [compost metagenome]